MIANRTSISLEENNKDELVIDSKVYWSVDKAVIYFLSKYDRSHF